MRRLPIIFLVILAIFSALLLGISYGRRVEQANKAIAYLLSTTPSPTTQPPESSIHPDPVYVIGHISSLDAVTVRDGNIAIGTPSHQGAAYAVHIFRYSRQNKNRVEVTATAAALLRLNSNPTASDGAHISLSPVQNPGTRGGLELVDVTLVTSGGNEVLEEETLPVRAFKLLGWTQ